MASIWEKAISILAEKLNSGGIAAVPSKWFQISMVFLFQILWPTQNKVGIFWEGYTIFQGITMFISAFCEICELNTECEIVLVLILVDSQGDITQV